MKSLTMGCDGVGRNFGSRWIYHLSSGTYNTGTTESWKDLFW